MFAKLNNPKSLFLKFSLCLWLLCVHAELQEEALFPDGERCTTNFDCESGYCTSDTGICATYLEGYLSLGPGICQNSDGSQAQALYKHQQGDICEEMCTDDDTCTGYSVSLYNNCMLFFSPSFLPLIGGGPSWGDSQCIIKGCDTSVRTDGMWYAPLDLPGEGRTVGTPEECRQRCVGIPECFYFNNFPNGGCHMAGKDATLQSMPGNPTVASGAVRCQELSTTVEPSMKPSGLPSTSPSFEQPTISPSYAPSFSPSLAPTIAPSTLSVTCRMTIDNEVSHVRYGGVDLIVSGQWNNWNNVKTFSYTPVVGHELEIGGFEHGSCHGCSCAGLLLECDDGFVSDQEHWVAWGGNTQSVAPSDGYSTPCSSGAGFSMPQGYSREMTKIWAANGNKYVWFKATPYATEECCSTFTLTGSRFTRGTKNGEYGVIVDQDQSGRPAYQGGEDNAYYIFYNDDHSLWKISTVLNGGQQASIHSTSACLANGDQLVSPSDSNDIWTVSDCFANPTGFHYASCGNQNSGCNETYAKEDSALLGVRCASDHMISEWREDACGATGNTIWYESDVWDEGCQILNYQDASEFCAKVGGRLPTLQEVQADCLKGSGCGHNYRQIWTSDMAPEPEVSTTLEASVKPSASPSFTLRSSTPSFSPSFNPSFTPTVTPSFEPTSKPTFTESSAKEELDLEASIFASSTVLTEENRMKVNASLTEPASITWFINDEPIDNYPLITAFENELVIVSGGGFEYGSVIDITMSATSIADPSKRTSESISINVNRPPESGECYCDGVTAFQPLTLLCGGWQDAHLPLTYDFVLETGRGSSLTLTKNQLSPAFTFEAPPGNFTIIANIRDSLGATATFPMNVSTALPSNSTLIASALESSQLTLKEASESGDVSTFASSVALIDLTLGAVEREHYDRRRLLDGSNVRSEMYGTFRDLAEQIFSDDDLLQLAQILNAIFSNKLQIEPNVLNDAITSVNVIRSKSNILTKNAADPLLEVLNTFSSSIFEDVSAHDTVALVQSIENSMHGTFRDAIRQFISGETYEVHFDEMNGSALRMSASDERSLRACGGSSFELPTSFSTEFSGITLDCITMSSSNFPEMLVSTPETPLSSPQSLTLYTDSEPLLIPQDKFQCDGFIIRHTINNASSIASLDDITASGKYESLALPKCAFFDTTTLEWSSDNCTLLSYDESEMVCQCSHLTTFMGVLESFEPEINSLEKETWQQFTLANIFARPTPLILCISVVLSIALLYLIIGEKTNRPLIASKECLPKERRSELFGQSPEGKIHRLLNKDSNACAKVWSLYKLKMRNEHIFFSMWTRQGHTNYSTKFRLLFFMVYLFTILLGSAIFYGQDQQHAVSELLWIVIVAVIGGGLVWLMQKVIKSSRPRFPIEELIAKDMSFIEEHGKTMTILNTDSFLEMDTVSLATQKRFVSETFEKMLSLSSLDDLIIEGTVSLELDSKRVPSKIKETGPRDVSDCHGGAIFQVMSQSEFSEFLFTDEDQSDVSLGPRDVSLRSVSDMIRDRINSTDLMSPTLR